MNAKDFSGFHELVEQFSGEMTLAEIRRLEGVDYRRYSYWRARHGYSQPRQKRAPRGMIEAIVTDVPAMVAASRSPGRANVRIEFENGLLFERVGIEVETLLEFIDKIRPALCLD